MAADPTITVTLARFSRNAQNLVSEDGIDGVYNDAPEARIAVQAAKIFGEQLIEDLGDEFASLTPEAINGGLDSFLKEVIGAAFEGFINEGLLNDAERVFRMDVRIFVTALLSAPLQVIYGFFSLKVERVIELVKEGGEILDRIAAKIQDINVKVLELDQALVLARNIAIIATAGPIAEQLLDQVNTLYNKIKDFEGRDFTFNLPGVTLVGVCTALEALASILTGGDVPTIDIFARIAEIEQELNRLISIIDEIVAQIVATPDFEANLLNSRRSLASLQGAQLDRLRRLLQFFIDATKNYQDQPALVVAQQAQTFGLQFKQLVSVLCRDVGSLSDVIKDTAEQVAFNALNLALAQIDLTPIQEVSAKIRSFIAIARAMITQDLGQRFQDEILIVVGAINAALLVIDLIRAAFAAFNLLDSPFVTFLEQALSDGGFDQAVAALTGTGDFDNLSFAASNTQSASGQLVCFIDQRINATTNDAERNRLFRARDILVAFERGSAAIVRADNTRRDLAVNESAGLFRRIRFIETVVLEEAAKAALE